MATMRKLRPNLMINAQEIAAKRAQTVIIPETAWKRSEEFASEIMDGLFLGSLHDALNNPELSRHKIDRILNVAQECNYDANNFSDPSGIKVMKLSLADHSDQPIAAFFERAFAFIDEARERKMGVLVHCHRGISRSATIVIAYVMRTLNLPFEQAMRYVKSRRNVINPNMGFMLALESFGGAPQYSTIRPCGLDDRMDDRIDRDCGVLSEPLSPGAVVY